MILSWKTSKDCEQNVLNIQLISALRKYLIQLNCYYYNYYLVLNRPLGLGNFYSIHRYWLKHHLPKENLYSTSSYAPHTHEPQFHVCGLPSHILRKSSTFILITCQQHTITHTPLKCLIYYIFCFLLKHKLHAIKVSYYGVVL